MLKWLKRILGSHDNDQVLVWLPCDAPDPTRYGIAPPGSEEDVNSQLAWIEAGPDTFAVPVVDCRSITRGIVSTAQDQQTLDRYVALRKDTGESLRAEHPEDARIAPCDLRYPFELGATTLPTGRRYSSRRLEYKWDIAHWDGHLLFSRSWTGVLIYRARFVIAGDELRIEEVEGTAATDDPVGGPRFDVAAVDFLVRALLLNTIVPHPVPDLFENRLRMIAMWSFKFFGCDARFGYVLKEGDGSRGPTRGCS
jgi:hypothetical protein